MRIKNFPALFATIVIFATCTVRADDTIDDGEFPIPRKTRAASENAPWPSWTPSVDFHLLANLGFPFFVSPWLNTSAAADPSTAVSIGLRPLDILIDLVQKLGLDLKFMILRTGPFRVGFSLDETYHSDITLARNPATYIISNTTIAASGLFHALEGHFVANLDLGMNYMHSAQDSTTVAWGWGPALEVGMYALIGERARDLKGFSIGIAYQLHNAPAVATVHYGILRMGFGL